jgi:hypothetical protein
MRTFFQPIAILHTACLAPVLLAIAWAQSPAQASYSKHAVISESNGQVQITANSPRPLAQILDALLQKYGWAANYEDPQYGAKDLVPSHADPKLILPSGGKFIVEFPASQTQEKTTQFVVDSYNRSQNPGRFELRNIGGTSVIVGTAARDDQGKVSPQPPLLDTPITIAPQSRTISATLDLICHEVSSDAVSGAGSSAVVIGVAPTALLDSATATVGGNKIPARDLLLQALAATHHKVYWRLLFDPNSKGYFLDLHLAE